MSRAQQACPVSQPSQPSGQPLLKACNVVDVDNICAGSAASTTFSSSSYSCSPRGSGRAACFRNSSTSPGRSSAQISLSNRQRRSDSERGVCRRCNCLSSGDDCSPPDGVRSARLSCSHSSSVHVSSALRPASVHSVSTQVAQFQALGPSCGPVEDSDKDRVLLAVARVVMQHILDDDGEVAEVFLEEGQGRVSGVLANVPGAVGRPSNAPSLASRSSLTSEEFDEELFLEKGKWAKSIGSCLRRCCAALSGRRSLPGRRLTVQEVLALLRGVAAVSDFQIEVSVVGVIYIERLLANNPALRLTKSNWRPILVAVLHLASKTWEDIHPWNAEFSAYLRLVMGFPCSASSLHTLELKILVGLGYSVSVPGEMYARYLFALREMDKPPTPLQNPLAEWESALPERAKSDSELTAHGLTEASDDDDDDHKSLRSFRSVCSAVSVVSMKSHKSAPSLYEKGLRRSRSSRSFGRAASSFLSPGATSSFASHSTALDLGSLHLQAEVDAQEQVWTNAVRLNPRNPYVGWFRHAPRAPPPSSKMTGRRYNRLQASRQRSYSLHMGSASSVCSLSVLGDQATSTPRLYGD
eukprot:TRINITY_DN35602_c0_g1_i1.p1 TRINITY_DN35602_c0_g1~~TRINITY_DN35602_c0_g1_i1.p1  ORF type:complete len:582 (+),score=39.49 TRINITY_DN35602_c0_g1_i1:79-1824(+)